MKKTREIVELEEAIRQGEKINEEIRWEVEKMEIKLQELQNRQKSANTNLSILKDSLIKMLEKCWEE